LKYRSNSTLPARVDRLQGARTMHRRAGLVTATMSSNY